MTLWSRQEGTAFAEYLVLYVLVSLGLAGATVLLGPALLQLYAVQRSALTFPLF